MLFDGKTGLPINEVEIECPTNEELDKKRKRRKPTGSDFFAELRKAVALPINPVRSPEEMLQSFQSLFAQKLGGKSGGWATPPKGVRAVKVDGAATDLDALIKGMVCKVSDKKRFKKQAIFFSEANLSVKDGMYKSTLKFWSMPLE